ncbi:MAG: Rpp14/Pop5 family protein [Methanomicrobiales archaeon]|nr:Rpp14/Pop5 family protein [Methanomicrobiales archaeon]
MRPRPPTFRVKKRYVLARIIPPWRIVEARVLGSAVHDAATSLWGDAHTALMQPAVMVTEKDLAILRCRRGTERDLITALATITAVGDLPLILRPLAVSGTILALKERGARLHREIQEEELAVKGRVCTVYRYQGHKVDLLERGIKGQNVVFFTTEDIEEL